MKESRKSPKNNPKIDHQLLDEYKRIVAELKGVISIKQGANYNLAHPLSREKDIKCGGGAPLRLFLIDFFLQSVVKYPCNFITHAQESVVKITYRSKTYEPTATLYI